MKKKLIVIFSVVLLFILIFFHFFSVLRISSPIGGNSIVLVQKINNPNRLFNLFLPHVSTVVKHGDLIIHKDLSYADKKFWQLKNKANRLYGKPGDLVEINNKNALVNQEQLKVGAEKIFFKYRISFLNSVNCNIFLKPYKVKLLETIADGMACDVICNELTAAEIAKKTEVENIRHIVYLRNTNCIDYFPRSSYHIWNKDYFGPVYVPEKTTTVFLNYKNAALYDVLINRFENHIFLLRNNRAFLNDREVESYTFTKDYYFMLNDNRDLKSDSRHWGFLPEDYIIGKVLF